MQALRIHAHGGPEVLSLDDVAEPPDPGPGEVVVRVLVNASATAYFNGDSNEAASTTATARLIADAAANVSTTWAPACTYASGDTVVAVPIGGVDVPPDAGINISAGRWPTVTEPGATPSWASTSTSTRPCARGWTTS